MDLEEFHSVTDIPMYRREIAIVPSRWSQYPVTVSEFVVQLPMSIRT